MSKSEGEKLKVGDIVKLSGCPYDEQIPEQAEKFTKLFNVEQTVTEIKDVSGLEGTTGQWIKTDKESEWTDKAWYHKITEKLKPCFKVYRMNEYDWWADYSEEEARKNYTKWLIESCGIDETDIDIENVVEMSSERMKVLKYYDEDLKHDITFEEEITGGHDEKGSA